MASEDQNIAGIGRALFENEIGPKIQGIQKGTFVVVDITSGDYEIGEDDLDATLALMRRRPGAITWAGRIGYPASYYIRALARPR